MDDRKNTRDKFKRKARWRERGKLASLDRGELECGAVHTVGTDAELKPSSLVT